LLDEPLTEAQRLIDFFWVIVLQVVIYEALLLLKEHYQSSFLSGASGDLTDKSTGSVVRFCDAVSNTKSLSRPNYINLAVTSQHHRC